MPHTGAGKTEGVPAALQDEHRATAPRLHRGAARCGVYHLHVVVVVDSKLCHVHMHLSLHHHHYESAPGAGPQTTMPAVSKRAAQQSNAVTGAAKGTPFRVQEAQHWQCARERVPININICIFIVCVFALAHPPNHYYYRVRVRVLTINASYVEIPFLHPYRAAYSHAHAHAPV